LHYLRCGLVLALTCLHARLSHGSSWVALSNPGHFQTTLALQQLSRCGMWPFVARRSIATCNIAWCFPRTLWRTETCRRFTCYMVVERTFIRGQTILTFPDLQKRGLSS